MRVNVILFTIFVAATFYSCSQSGGKIAPFPNDAPTFTAQVGDYVSRAHDATWESGDKIGLFAITDVDWESAPYEVNLPYETKAGSLGSFTKVDRGILYARDVESGFVAYYPYRDDIYSEIYPIDVTEQGGARGLPAIDLLYATTKIQYGPTNPNVNLSFSHQLTSVVFLLERDESALGSVMPTDLKILGVNSRAKFNLRSGEISDGESGVITVGEFKRAEINGKEVERAEAIVIPGEYGEAKIVGLFGGREFEIVPLSFMAGKRYSYTLKLSLKDKDVEVEVGDGGITDWDDIDGGEFDIEGEKDSDDGETNGAGTAEQPYSIADLPKLDDSQKSDVWVRGVVLGSNPEMAARSMAQTDKNIVLGESGESDIGSGVVVEFRDGDEYQRRLNIVDNPELIKSVVSVRADITQVGEGYLLTNLSGEQGGKEPVEEPDEPDEPTDKEWERFFFESFDNIDCGENSGVKIANAYNWDMSTPYSYSDPTCNAEIKMVYKNTPALWFVGRFKTMSSFVISGVSTKGYKKPELTFMLSAFNATNTEEAKFEVLVNSVKLQIDKREIPDIQRWESMTLNLPEGENLVIELIATPSDHKGVFIDDISIGGYR